MRKYKFSINGNPFNVTIKQLSDDHALVDVNGSEYNVDIIDEPIHHKTPKLTREKAVATSERRPIQTTSKVAASAMGSIKAPLPGIILEILVKESDDVQTGQTVMKMEAMKMENNIQATRDGIVKSIHVKKGDSVLEGAMLMEIGE
ncbi:acetyl-CoA carboxylase biotin carboxyl carrier protein subunit [candidate division KSB1 bacterium]|nr:acetyl-CoA carboxylase biotin carboxyl carrier protein subunit [candidate division KSB1 bacterium]